MYKKYFAITLLVIVSLFYLFYVIGTTKITVCFKELEPFKHNIPVYYKGFKLGHTTKIYPGKDYKTTMVDMRILLKNLELPSNVTATMRRKDKNDYIEIVYPNSPYIEKLRNRDIIEGHLGSNFEHYLQEQANNGGLDEIKNNVNNTIVSAGETFNALTDMINTVSYILEDVRPAIKESADNLNIATQELVMSTKNIRTSLEKGYLDKTLYNFEQTSNNLVGSTKNINGFTSNVNEKSINLLNCLLANLNVVVNNVNEIVIGIGNTLRKRFGGLRLVFGKTLK